MAPPLRGPYSTVATFAPTLLPEGTRNVYFESAAVIVTLILLGRYLEARAKGRTGDAIKGLLALAPDTALVERDGTITTLPFDAIRTGDILLIKPGERLAVDGTVLTGNSFIDESMITGEPLPVEKSPGDPVTGGTINDTGAPDLHRHRRGPRHHAGPHRGHGGRRPGRETADSGPCWTRSPPGSCPPSSLSPPSPVITWLTLGPDPALTFALVAAVAVLIIACPCAMGLATPTSIMVGTGRAAELGVLFRPGRRPANPSKRARCRAGQNRHSDRGPPGTHGI